MPNLPISDYDLIQLALIRVDRIAVKTRSPEKRDSKVKTELKLAVVQTALLAVCVLLLVVIAVRPATGTSEILELHALLMSEEHLRTRSNELFDVAKDKDSKDESFRALAEQAEPQYQHTKRIYGKVSERAAALEKRLFGSD